MKWNNIVKKGKNTTSKQRSNFKVSMILIISLLITQQRWIRWKKEKICMLSLEQLNHWNPDSWTANGPSLVLQYLKLSFHLGLNVASQDDSPLVDIRQKVTTRNSKLSRALDYNLLNGDLERRYFEFRNTLISTLRFRQDLFVVARFQYAND